MGILKIELEVPEFKEAIELSMILKKDGEVITSSIPLDKDSDKNTRVWRQDIPPVWKQAPAPEPSKFIVGDDPTVKGPYCSDTTSSGNYMNINIDDL